MQININIQIYTIQNLTNVYTKSKNNHANIDKHSNIYNTKSYKYVYTTWDTTFKYIQYKILQIYTIIQLFNYRQSQ